MLNVLKIFFRYGKYYSVTAMLGELAITDFDSVIVNFKNSFKRQTMLCCSNTVVRHLLGLHVI